MKARRTSGGGAMAGEEGRKGEPEVSTEGSRTGVFVEMQ